MPHIPVFYGERHRAYVDGVIILDGRRLEPAVYFLVDPAAENTIITPYWERALKRKNPELWKNLHFHSPGKGVLPLDTLMGKAYAKCINKVRHQDTGLVFLDHKEKPVAKYLDFLYFSDYPPRNKRAKDSLRPGEHLRYSILGIDVLSQFSLIAMPDDGDRRRACLTTDTRQLESKLAGTGIEAALQVAAGGNQAKR